MSQPDYDSDPVEIPGYRRTIGGGHSGSGGGRIVLISALTSVIVSAITVYAMLHLGVASAPAPAAVANVPAAAPASSSVDVPKVVGMQVDSASELLTHRKLQLVISERRADADSAADTVLEQTPLAESRIAPGQAVSVVVSSGAPPQVVPSVAGQTLEAAKAALQAAGFTVGAVTEVDGAPPGEVTATMPAAGTAASVGQAIALSVGKAAAGIALPKLVGTPVAQARKTLSELGLAVGKVQERYDADFRAYIVLSQDPAEGSQVAPGSKVDLIVNEGD